MCILIMGGKLGFSDFFKIWSNARKDFIIERVFREIGIILKLYLLLLGPTVTTQSQKVEICTCFSQFSIC
jgi:hypothetical protein